MQKGNSKLVSITERAAEKIKEYMTNKDEQYLGLTLSIESSSCSCCTSYGLTLANSVSKSDLVIKGRRLNIIVSKSDMKYLKGSEIDYVETFQRSGFRINNPNKVSSCECA